MNRLVDLTFPVRGGAIPADHAYAVFSALCRLIPWAHSQEDLGIHTINGQILPPRRLELTERSALRLRLPVERVPDCIALTGQHLEVGDGLRLGFPSLHPLVPAASTFSRLVTIRGFTEPDSFLDAARRQLAHLDIGGEPSLVPRPATAPREPLSSGGSSRWVRRTVRIRDREIVGFALRVDHLTANESLRLQEEGLGGRRHLGCGLFIAPARVGR